MNVSCGSLNRLGVDLYLKGDFEGARLHYLAALKLEPKFLPALSNIASALAQQNKLVAAAAYLNKFLSFSPESADQLIDLGNVLMRLKRYDEARGVLNSCIELAPNNFQVWYNLALVTIRTGSPTKALEYLDKAIELGSSGPTTENDRAHFLFKIGDDLKTAFELYEARWATMVKLPSWNFDIPEWKGQDLTGKSILFHGEQGYGDSIMTSRFARDLVRRGAKVTICLFSDLCSLFEAQKWENVDVLDMEKLDAKRARTFDYHSPMYSAMRWLGIERSNIDPRPYLTVPPVVGPRVHEKSAFNVGICWASGTRGNEFDLLKRVAPLDLWLSLSELDNFQLYSLQKGPEAADISSLGVEGLIIDETPYFHNWADTAAFINKLDLVITIDTAIAHLAGAMGKSVWMLSQYDSCWRWWELENESGLPWYSSMVIIPQIGPNEWGDQLQTVWERLR